MKVVTEKMKTKMVKITKSENENVFALFRSF
jgi:hypothetical protein